MDTHAIHTHADIDMHELTVVFNITVFTIVNNSAMLKGVTLDLATVCY